MNDPSRRTKRGFAEIIGQGLEKIKPGTKRPRNENTEEDKNAPEQEKACFDKRRKTVIGTDQRTRAGRRRTSEPSAGMECVIQVPQSQSQEPQEQGSPAEGPLGGGAQPAPTRAEAFSPESPPFERFATSTPISRQLQSVPRYYTASAEKVGLGDHLANLYFANDETQKLPALVMSPELLAKMQVSLVDARELDNKRLERQTRLKIMNKWWGNAERELADIPQRWQYIKDDPKRADEAEQQVRLFEKLRDGAKRMQDEKDAIERQWEQIQERAESSRVDAEVLLEVAFREAGIMIPERETFDRSNEALAEEFAVVNTYAPPIFFPVDIDWDFPDRLDEYPALQQDPSFYEEAFSVEPEPAPNSTARDEFWQCYDNWQRAQASFDRRNRETAADYFRRQGADITAIPQDLLDHDLAQLQQNRKLTRNLIEAEQRFASAKRVAAEYNLDLAAPEQTSGFGLTDGDLPHARLSHTRDPTGFAWEDPRIVTWLDAVLSDVEVQEQSREPFEGRRLVSVGPKDSNSQVDYGRDRERIDKVEANRHDIRRKVMRDWGQRTTHETGDHLGARWHAAHKVEDIGVGSKNAK
ncbi:unnamed protein product [Zymoseptoria tritici ST99CH_3D1]|nr:unnamed protein product [Zymoseptoria tritici ST99CH_3D1]